MIGFLQSENLKKLKDNLPCKFYDKIVDSIYFIVDNVELSEEIYLAVVLGIT